MRVLVCGDKPWVRDFYAAWTTEWETHLCQDPKRVIDVCETFNPTWVVFPHWSNYISRVVYEKRKTILFHMTDLPYGRGGTPLQNLIVRGYRETKLSAIQVVEELDAGPVYLKRPLALYGSAEEVYRRMMGLAFNMAREIIEHALEPIPQKGEVTVFARRTPADSRIPPKPSPVQLYDFIRMLDAQGYPKAFLPWGAGRIEFSKAHMSDNSVQARAEFYST